MNPLLQFDYVYDQVTGTKNKRVKCSYLPDQPFITIKEANRRAEIKAEQKKQLNTEQVELNTYHDDDEQWSNEGAVEGYPFK